MRSGPVVYIVVGALVIALAGVALVLTGNGSSIARPKSRPPSIRRRRGIARARLAAYTQFKR